MNRVDSSSEWWATELWRLVRPSPPPTELFLTFLVDPLREGALESGVTSVSASARPLERPGVARLFEHASLGPMVAGVLAPRIVVPAALAREDGETLVDLDVWTKNSQDVVLAPGTATVALAKD